MAVIDGTADADTLTGTAAADTINGLAGDDTLGGGAGDDTLEGGAGSDSFIGGSGGGIGSTYGADALNGGDGVDTVYYSDEEAFAAVTVNLATGVGGGQAQGDTYSSIENVTGTGFDDTLIGDAAANLLIGGVGNDTLRGGAGDDTLTGGSGAGTGATYGADALDGGDGNDTVDYNRESAFVAVTVNLATGASGGMAEGDTYNSIENVTGTQFDDTLTGDDGANVLIGTAGNDTIEGGAGDDTLIGGNGSGAGATYGADVLNGGDGNDTVDYSRDAPFAAVTVNLATGVGGGIAEDDTYNSIENVTGTEFNDTLIGGAAANAFSGGDGNDDLSGGAGGDNLNGGDGTDVGRYSTSGAAVTVDLAAGTGTGGDAEGDTLTSIENLAGSKFDDTLSGNGGVNVINGGGGNDTVAGAGDNDNLYGGNGADQVDGGDEWDTLQGEAGDDHLIGGAGGDILRGGDGADHLTGGADYDVGSYWDSTVGVTINLETNVNSGGMAEGDTIDRDVEIIHGSNHDDTMTGNALSNALVGFDGHDVLSGAGGNDTLRGGMGADTLNGGSGIDYFSYTAVSDSTAAAADTIQGFQHGDLIWVQKIDADGNAANGDTAFSFIGTAAFSGTAGQLRYESVGDTTTVSADVNGDGTADMVIHLDGAITLQASDFML
ncbi:Ca2+-binding RTX toxin-like protein [Inquilinus ginsengisoli]|uniref:calcium-binding protein n=1 Tax=Inquilinus ginsengisoli TaxID=363840 RepID=UPI003D20930D